MTQYQPPHINRKLNVQAWWLTALLISINVGLFIWQIISGVDISDPAIKMHFTGVQILHHLLFGQPERLFTSMFFTLVLFTLCSTCGLYIFLVMWLKLYLDVYTLLVCIYLQACLVAFE